jgi:DNA-binding LytR/AlgR family response regulator
MKFMTFILILWALLLPMRAEAQAFVMIEDESVRVCPVTDSFDPPDFSPESCHSEPFVTVDPQGRHIWMRARLNVDQDYIEANAPMALFVSAKASSEIFFNGVRIGAIGRPGGSRLTEQPGRMDGHVYVPTDLIRDGENIVVLRLSSMHGFLRLARPMHLVALGPYGEPTQRIIPAYWSSLVTLGTFLLGFLFFGVTAIRGEDREGSTILSLASLFAGSQLMTEASRGLFAYSYPFHDIRLILILSFAYLFSLCLLAFLLLRLTNLDLRNRAIWVAGLAIIMFCVVIAFPGFDVKTLLVLLTAAVVGMIGCGLGIVQRRPGATISLASLVALIGLMFYSYSRFLDVYFYYAAAALLLFLFYLQAQAIVRERRDRKTGELRSQSLEVALAQARQQSAPLQIELISSGRVEYVSTDRIVQLKGAGDYVEVQFTDDTTKLYNGSLNGLESDLPASFIRVHRSHIVNTAFVEALERELTGTGQLILSTGLVVPVSRRIMPKVKSALSELAM